MLNYKNWLSINYAIIIGFFEDRQSFEEQKMCDSHNHDLRRWDKTRSQTGTVEHYSYV